VSAAAQVLFEPVRRGSRRRYWTPAAVLVLGVASILLLLSTLRVSERETEQGLAAAVAIDDLQVAVAYWHLWLEEHLTGDPYLDLDDDVLGNQALAVAVTSLLLRGGRREEGERIAPLEGPLRRRAEALEAALARFGELSDERLEHPEIAGVGSELDQRFDAEFRRVKELADELRRGIGEDLRRSRARIRARVWVTVGAWMLIVAAALAGLWRRETRRQRAEETLRESQRWLATTLASIGDAVVTTDLEGRVLFMNPMAEKLTGWPRGEAQGQPIDEVMRAVAEDGSPIENPATTALRTGERSATTNSAAMADRRRRSCYAIDQGAAPIRDEGGELLGAVLVFRDVSERRRTEKALRQREAELRRAQKMEAVGRLAGGISHDVSNYLGAIRGHCEMAMMKRESGDALAGRMGAAIATADKVSALIRQLLAFSRRQPVQPEVVDLNAVVADMERLMGRLLGEDVVLETRLDGEIASVEVDPSQIEQVLVNLLVNARDAMPTGGRITVATAHVEADEDFVRRHPAATGGRHVRLTVTDTGCGIPAEVQDKIFDPFFTTKAESGSSGLGLATVYSLVRQYGGVVGVESVVGEGTTFEILLPASDRKAARRRSAVAEAVAPTARARVLLVEDNDDMRSSARALLETMGHEVRVASGGDEALEMLGDGEAPCELLVTDVIMPRMSGKELYDRVRERHPEVRCLFISGYTDNVMLRHGVAQDRVHFLQKPFSFESLARKVEEVLQGPEPGL